MLHARGRLLQTKIYEFIKQELKRLQHTFLAFRTTADLSKLEGLIAKRGTASFCTVHCLGPRKWALSGVDRESALEIVEPSIDMEVAMEKRIRLQGLSRFFYQDFNSASYYRRLSSDWSLNVAATRMSESRAVYQSLSLGKDTHTHFTR